MDIEVTSDLGRGYNVGWMVPGEWLEYTVSVAETDYYRIDFIADSGESTTSMIS